jgi:hypothetical protein
VSWTRRAVNKMTLDETSPSESFVHGRTFQYMAHQTTYSLKLCDCMRKLNLYYISFMYAILTYSLHQAHDTEAQRTRRSTDNSHNRKYSEELN